MTASLATLNGRSVTTCRVQTPAFGLWWAEVECASQDALSGAAELVLSDVTMRGTIVSGGAYQTRTRYRIVGGKGGWGRTIKARGYASDLGVKAALVLHDAAADCGEQLDAPALGSVGPAFARAEGPASRVLDEVAPRGWYVDEGGVTRIGRRPKASFNGAAVRLVNDAAQSRIELAPATLVGLVPGAVVDGLEAVDVEHVIGDDGKLRTTLWGRGIADTARMSEALRRLIEHYTAGTRYYAPWEYRVVQRIGERLDLQAVRVSSGMPDLRAVRIRQGASGVRVHPPIGSLVLVSFVDGDPARPVVTAWDDQAGAGAVADEIALQAGSTGTTLGVTEHATSAEALVAAVQQTFASIGPIIGGGFGAAVTALSVAPAFDAVVPLIATRTLAATTKAAIAAALATKAADTGGDTPNLGWPAVRGG